MARARAAFRWPAIAAAVLLGAGFALTFAPWGNGWVSLAVLALFAALLAHGVLAGDRPGPAARAFGFGMGWFCVGVGWLFISMHQFGGMPAPLAALAVLLLAAYLSIYFVASSWLAARALARRGPFAFALVFGAGMVLAEWLRGTVFTGLPWVAIGYAQVDGPLAGYAPVLGTYGLGGIAATIAALVGVAGAIGLANGGGVPSPAGRVGVRGSTGVVGVAGVDARRTRWLVAVAVTVLALLGAGQALRSITWSTPVGLPLEVRLIQGNVPQQMKFDPARAMAAMEAYTAAIEAAAVENRVGSRPDLILLPETAWIVPWQRTPPALAERVLAVVRDTGATVALGLPMLAQASGPDDGGLPALTNSILAIMPDPGTADGVRVARYDKRHLVPFGEFIPPGFRWFVDLMQIPLGDFERGAAGQTPFAIGDQRVAGLVCYEDAFGSEVVEAVAGAGGATVLANVTNVAWFGRSHAADQHLQMARMRTLEAARPMIRATNTGMTAAIDAEGRVLAVAEPYVQATIAASVQGRTGLTPYARTGDWPSLGVALALVVLLLVPRRRPTGRAS